jgi:hypothetical protein
LGGEQHFASREVTSCLEDQPDAQLALSFGPPPRVFVFAVGSLAFDIKSPVAVLVAHRHSD